MNRLRKPVSEFFFAAQPTEWLGIWRILFGLYLIFVWFQVLPDASFFWGNHAFVSAKSMLNETYGPSLFWNFADQDRALAFVGFALLVSLFSFCAGFWTRSSGAAAFVCLASLHSRNPHIINLGDRLMRELILFAALAPCGASYSVDAWRARRTALPAPQWPIRLMQMQISAIYLVTLLIKLHGKDWLDGTAVYYSSRLQGISEKHFAFIFDHLATIQILTWGTLALEFCLAVLIWVPRWRNVLILVGLIFHVALLVTTAIPRFEQTMIFGLLLFIDPQLFQLWVGKRSGTLQRSRGH